MPGDARGWEASAGEAGSETPGLQNPGPVREALLPAWPRTASLMRGTIAEDTIRPHPDRGSSAWPKWQRLRRIGAHRSSRITGRPWWGGHGTVKVLIGGPVETRWTVWTVHRKGDSAQSWPLERGGAGQLAPWVSRGANGHGASTWNGGQLALAAAGG